MSQILMYGQGPIDPNDVPFNPRSPNPINPFYIRVEHPADAIVGGKPVTADDLLETAKSEISKLEQQLAQVACWKAELKRLKKIVKALEKK